MGDLSIELLSSLPVAEQEVEIVERKGVGHPDYICDAALEAVSLALSRTYMERFSRVLHFNIDKGLLAAGSVEKGFGSGRVLRPMEFIVGDRATFKAKGVDIDVAAIAEDTIRKWFNDNLEHIDSIADLDVNIILKPGSSELVDLFSTNSPISFANDTSAAVGYAPLTKTERAVLEFEDFLNSSEFKGRFPDTGEDVKVMGLRRGGALELTFAMPLISTAVASEADYFVKRGEIKEEALRFAQGLAFEEVEINFNRLDRPGKGLDGVYMTLLGTSAEDGDSGQVGRGNRVNGVIPVMRPIGTEAAAGKNPTSHVGKIYNILAHKVAGEIYEGVEGVVEVYVYLLGAIGSPIDRPWQVSIKLIPAPGFDRVAGRRLATDIVENNFAEMEAFTRGLCEGLYPVC